MKAPNLYKVEDLIKILEKQLAIESYYEKSKWIPHRLSGVCSLKNRIRLAWLVFRGKCDVLLWPHNIWD